MKTDETFHLKPQIEWGDVEPVKVLYVSSDETIASVDDGGLVTAHKEGKANIEVYLENGLASTECQITVAKVAAARLTILVPDRIVKVGQNERFQFTTKVYPDDVSFSSVKWSGSTYIDENGLFQCRNMSKHTIIATSEDGQASDTCMVYVQGEIPLESFSVEPKDCLLYTSPSPRDCS